MRNTQRNFLALLLAFILLLKLSQLIALGASPKIERGVPKLLEKSAFQQSISTDSPNFPSLPPLKTPLSQKQYAPDHIIVRFKPDVDTTTASRIVGQFGATLAGPFFHLGQVTIYKVNIGPKETVEYLVKKLSNNINVEYAEFDGVIYLQ